MQNFRYARQQVAVHWVAALVIVFLLLSGMFVLEDMPNTVEKIGNLRIHMIFGALAGLLVITRIAMRRRLPAPPSLPGDKLAHAGHMALNLAILLMAASGMLLALQSGALDAVIGNGVLPENFKDFTPRKVHGLVAKIAMGLIVLHVAAALYHQLIVKDGLISRMRLGGR